MDFERIGKNTVQCHMTVEEMNEYGLRIEDFFTNQEKSRDFLEQLVERAGEEIGYEVESGMVSMQLVRLPDDSLIITFSDRGDESLQNVLNQIQNLAGMIDHSTVDEIMSMLAGAEDSMDEDDDMHLEEELSAFDESALTDSTEERRDYREHMEQVDKQRKAAIKRSESASRVFCFKTLDLVEGAAQSIYFTRSFPSRLYKDTASGNWYLLIKKGKLKLEAYQLICQRLEEFGKLCSKHPFVEQYCKEHYQCIIGKHALQTIKEYIS